MTLLIVLIASLFVAAAVVIYRLVRENDDLHDRLALRDVDLYYLRERNKALNGELLCAAVRVTVPAQTASTPTPVTVTLPPSHPQKRQPKSIRGKRK